MRRFNKWLLNIIPWLAAFLLVAVLVWAGSETANKNFYKPSYGTTQRNEYNDFNTHLDNLDARLSVNVKAFGAKGDGSTDDTAAFAAARAFLMTTYGGRIFVPRGVYKTNIKFGDGTSGGKTYRVTLVGESSGTSGGYGATLVPAINADPVISIKGDYGSSSMGDCVQNIGIKNLRIDGSASTTTGIHIGQAFDIRLENVMIYKMGGHGIVLETPNHLFNINIERCRIQENGQSGTGWGIYHDTSTYPAAGNTIRVRDNQIATNASGNILLSDNSPLIEGNTIEGAPSTKHGLHLKGCTGAHVTSGNHFEYNQAQDVAIENSHGVVIEGNYFFGSSPTAPAKTPIKTVGTDWCYGTKIGRNIFRYFDISGGSDYLIDLNYGDNSAIDYQYFSNITGTSYFNVASGHSNRYYLVSQKAWIYDSSGHRPIYLMDEDGDIDLAIENDTANVKIRSTENGDFLSFYSYEDFRFFPTESTNYSEIGRGTTDADIQFIALRNASGTLVYIYPNPAGDGVVVSTTKP